MDHISKHLEIRENKELQKQEQRPLKTGKELELALKSSLIMHSHEADISIMLKYVMLKIGLRKDNLPSKEEKAVLISHIYQNYPGNTIDEIRLAFDMAIRGSLSLKPEEVKCYENFSCAYFSQIMNAYLFWSEQEHKFLKTEPPPPIKILTDEQLDNLHRMWTEEFYQQIRNGIVKEVPDYSRAILVKDKLIERSEDADLFFTWKLGNNVKNIYAKDVQ